jgi:hypothetical protein
MKSLSMTRGHSTPNGSRTPTSLSAAAEFTSASAQVWHAAESAPDAVASNTVINVIFRAEQLQRRCGVKRIEAAARSRV